MGDQVQAIRTSGDMDTGEKWKQLTDNILLVDTVNRNFHATLKGNSITTYMIEGVTFNHYGS